MMAQARKAPDNAMRPSWGKVYMLNYEQAAHYTRILPAVTTLVSFRLTVGAVALYFGVVPRPARQQLPALSIRRARQGFMPLSSLQRESADAARSSN